MSEEPLKSVNSSEAAPGGAPSTVPKGIELLLIPTKGREGQRGRGRERACVREKRGSRESSAGPPSQDSRWESWLTNSPGDLWRDKWTTLSGPRSRLVAAGSDLVLWCFVLNTHRRSPYWKFLSCITR